MVKYRQEASITWCDLFWPNFGQKMPKIISLHDVLEPLKQALLASRDVIISSQICGSNLQKVFTLGDGCWLPNLWSCASFEPRAYSENPHPFVRWLNSWSGITTVSLSTHASSKNGVYFDLLFEEAPCPWPEANRGNPWSLVQWRQRRRKGTKGDPRQRRWKKGSPF